MPSQDPTQDDRLAAYTDRCTRQPEASPPPLDATDPELAGLQRLVALLHAATRTDAGSTELKEKVWSHILPLYSARHRRRGTCRLPPDTPGLEAVEALIERALTDPDFRARLQADAAVELRRAGVDPSPVLLAALAEELGPTGQHDRGLDDRISKRRL